MDEAKKVEIEITNKVVIPQSVYEERYVPTIADRGEVIEVYADVADKLSLYHNAVIVTKESPASIKETEKKADDDDKKRRENFAKDKQGK